MSYYNKVAHIIGVAGIPEDIWDIIIICTDFIIIQSLWFLSLPDAHPHHDAQISLERPLWIYFYSK